MSACLRTAMLAAGIGVCVMAAVWGTGCARRGGGERAQGSHEEQAAQEVPGKLNEVARNNVSQVNLLALVVLLDSMPQATGSALAETTEWERSLAERIRQLADGAEANNAVLAGGLKALRERMAGQRDILKGIAQRVGEYRVPESTCWKVPGRMEEVPHGKLWQKAALLDKSSQAVVESLGSPPASQPAQGGGTVAEMLSASALSGPWARRGTFEDFQGPLCGRQRVLASMPATAPSVEKVPEGIGPATRPTGGAGRPIAEPLYPGPRPTAIPAAEEVQERVGATITPTGGRGGAIPDLAYPHRLGPWATYYKWRDCFRRATRWEWVDAVPVGPGLTRGSQGNVNLAGRRTGQTARGSGDNRGMAGWWRAAEWEVCGYFTYGPYDWAMRRISWHAVGDNSHPGQLRDTYFHDYMNRLSSIKLNYMCRSQNPQYIHEPNWIVDYGQATQIGQTQPGRVVRTMFYLVEIASSVPQGDPRWLTPGTYRTNAKDPIAIWARGWVSTEDANRWPIQKVGKCIWKDSYNYETTQDVEIGIQLKRDPAGKPLWQPVYMAAWYVWVGIDVGGSIPVDNPCNWGAEDRLPAPMLLDANAVPRLNGPIHNASSWDLWTPDWKAGPARTALGQDLVPASQPATTIAPPPAGGALEKEITDVLDFLLGTK